VSQLPEEFPRECLDALERGNVIEVLWFVVLLVAGVLAYLWLRTGR
jgi:hypothetical protein